MFYSLQNNTQKEKYKQYLQAVGSLSNLYSDSTTPYLYYRAAENLFCLAFNAENLSRSDVSADAMKNNTGIGLKTFLHGNGNTFQKVAEFNAINRRLRDLSDEETVMLIAQSRNIRIQSTITQFGLDSMIYHCVTRNENSNHFHEFNMDQIDLANINIQPENRNSIRFTDGINEYSFSRSKNTLLKRFVCDSVIDSVDIEILENPFDALSALIAPSNIEPAVLHAPASIQNPCVYLPLYAPSSREMAPAERSGLNQWNASGRPRHSDEVYIPVPSWIHQKFSGFFPSTNDISFDLTLPDGQILSASMNQAGQKGLMSNPNRALGQWLLRDVLQLPEDTLVTRDILDMADIDSAIVEKLSDGRYKIDFASVGKYEQFKLYNQEN